MRIEVEGPPLITAACHCTGCQRMTASAFSLSALYAENQFRIVSGDTCLGGMKGAARHHFCKRCLSWLFTYPDGLSDMVNLRTPMLENAGEFEPFVELYVNEGLKGSASGAPHRFEMAPSIEAFMALTKDYSIWEKRPT